MPKLNSQSGLISMIRALLADISNRPNFIVDHPNANLERYGVKSGQIEKITPPYEVKKKFYMK